jgi:glycosyltransferase involved in cell wall biosynthesis
MSSKDARRALEKLKKSLSGLRNVEENIYVWSPLAIPYHGVFLADWVNTHLVTAMVKRLITKLEMKNPIIWSYLPNAIDIIERLSEQMPTSQTVYHCIDNYAEFTDVPKSAFERMERRMLQRADLTVVSAKLLYESKKPYARQITYIPHGINLSEFRNNLERSVKLEGMSGLRRPIAGFVGRIADWVDLPLISRCARELPNWDFVVIGPSIVPLAPYLGIPNVHFLGRRDYQDLPNYIREFDVCLIPFIDIKVVATMNPLKMYEYLAVGKPVVTIPMPEVTDFAHVVTIAKPSDFPAAIVSAFETDSEAARAKRIESVSGLSWGDIAERILSQLAERSNGNSTE